MVFVIMEPVLAVPTFLEVIVPAGISDLVEMEERKIVPRAIASAPQDLLETSVNL